MRTIEWKDGIVVTIDQTKLPERTVFLKLRTCDQVVEAIENMRIRGAPLLGAAAAFALALTAHNSRAKENEALVKDLELAADSVRKTRPTAINLFWALDRILQKARSFRGSARELTQTVVAEAQRIADEDESSNLQMGKHGSELVRDGDTVLTHCNAGELATVRYGTALGVIRAAWEQGKKIKVIATETRPKLQGARLTAYELVRDGIPVTLVTDNMVGYLMHKRMVKKVIVGADRIVQDAVINKIGTYTIAVLAKEHEIPFYVAAPKSTFDLSRLASDVEIEQRNPEEVTHIGSHRIAARGVQVLNPAFDVTPLEYVTAIICEEGVLGESAFRKFKGGSRRLL